MNIFDRFSRVAKANINNVLKNLEDPEKIMNQALEDMQVRPVVSYGDCDFQFATQRTHFLTIIVFTLHNRHLVFW